MIHRSLLHLGNSLITWIQLRNKLSPEVMVLGYLGGSILGYELSLCDQESWNLGATGGLFAVITYGSLVYPKTINWNPLQCIPIGLSLSSFQGMIAHWGVDLMAYDVWEQSLHQQISNPSLLGWIWRNLNLLRYGTNNISWSSHLGGILFGMMLSRFKHYFPSPYNPYHL